MVPQSHSRGRLSIDRGDLLAGIFFYDDLGRGYTGPCGDLGSMILSIPLDPRLMLGAGLRMAAVNVIC